MLKWIQKRSDRDSTAPKAQQEPQWPWFVERWDQLRNPEESFEGKKSKCIKMAKWITWSLRCSISEVNTEKHISTFMKKSKNKDNTSNQPSIFPIVLHWDQAVLASNWSGNSKVFGWTTTGILFKSCCGVDLTPSRRLNCPTCKEGGEGKRGDCRKVNLRKQLIEEIWKLACFVRGHE